MKVMLYKETVSNEMWELLQTLMKDEVLKDYILVGGTALALRLGHRLSVDIDLFTMKGFDSEKMFQYLKNNYNVSEVKEENILVENTVMTYIDDIKVDILTHEYPLVDSVENIDGIRVISNTDIGAMKLHAIHQSGSRYKDFVDMYYLLEEKPLKFYLEAYEEKYRKDAYWASVGLNTYDKITTFEAVDILREKKPDWKTIKNRLEKSTKHPSHKFSQGRDIPPINPNKRRGFRR